MGLRTAPSTVKQFPSSDSDLGKSLCTLHWLMRKACYLAIWEIQYWPSIYDFYQVERKCIVFKHSPFRLTKWDYRFIWLSWFRYIWVWLGYIALKFAGKDSIWHRHWIFERRIFSLSLKNCFPLWNKISFWRG